MAVPYDFKHPDLEAVRLIFFDWLRAQSGMLQLCKSGDSYDPFVEYVGSRAPQELAFSATQVFWQLVIEGVAAPGANSQMQGLPRCHVTEYGQSVIKQAAGHPHDPVGYIKRLKDRVPNIDNTVLAYVSESLMTFRRGAIIAAAVMLGVAAERVFLLLCESLEAALGNGQEKRDFRKLLDRFPIKPKLDSAHNKFLRLQAQKTKDLPDNATLTVTAMYDLLRSQRNDLGHPRDTPPQLEREEVFANLQVFPQFYQTAEEVRGFLGSHTV